MPKSDDLTPKQQRFVQEFLIDMNAKQAAIRAGYSEHTAKEIGCENLTKPNVQAALKKRFQRISKKSEVTVERVLEELALLAFSDVSNLEVDEKTGKLKAAEGAPKGATRSVASVKKKRGKDGRVTTEFRLWPKTAATEQLGKYLAMFVDRSQSDVNVNVGWADLVKRAEPGRNQNDPE